MVAHLPPSITEASPPEQLDLIDAIEAQKRAENLNANPEPIETERDRLKATAIDRGVVWCRGILAERSVARLSELTDIQVRELLHA